MTSKSELNTSNYKRIFWINGLLTIPLLVFFAWPYIIFGYMAAIKPIINYAGAVIFAVPFTLTLLHGHVTIALGSAHRQHYYQWLDKYPLTYGLLFHDIFISTRFRLVILIVSLLIFLGGWLAN